MSRFASRVLTGTSLALLAALLLWLDGRYAPGRLARIVVMLLAALSVWELSRMGRFRGGGLAAPLWCAALVVALTDLDLGAPEPGSAPDQLGELVLRALGPALVVRALARLVGRPGRLARADLWAPFLAVWLLPPLFSLVLVDRDFGPEGLAVLVILAKVGDNAGYFVGRAMGKRHPFPSISPGKTVAGCVASLLAGLATGAILLPFTLGEPTLAQGLVGALVGGALNLAAQASDLSESWVKRQAGVKDSSALVGPSGGVLDVIDSLFFAAPLGLLFFSWVYGTPGR